LFVCDDAYDTSPGLTLCHSILVPDHLAAGSRSHGSRLGCPPCGGGYVVPGLSIPVGYCWQNSRCCQSAPRTAAQIRRQHRVAPERHSSAAGSRGADVRTRTGAIRVAGLLVCSILLLALRREYPAADCSALMLLLEPAANIPWRLTQLRFQTLSPWSVSNYRVLVVSNDSRYHGA
jgi:hypothetical protein